MTNSKHTKRALLASILSVVLCAAMLVGTTFAWFTDSVTNSGNIIKSGKLDVAMEWANGTEDLESAKWQDASEGAIFDYDLWEPGYTEARHIRVTNKGTLALKYQLQIAATDEAGKLADVIDVYAFDNGKQLTGRADLVEGEKIGTLADVLAGNTETPYENNLSAGGSHYVTIALKMQETAGNEYQNLSIGSEFAIKLLATQYTEEKDSFDNRYDKDAEWPLPPVSQVGSNLDLKDAIGSNGDGRAVLTNDIVIEGTKDLPNCSVYIRHPDTFIGSADNTPRTITSGTGQPAAFRVQGSANGFAGYDTYNIEFSNVILKTKRSGTQYSSTIALEEMGNKSVNIVGGQFESVSHTTNAIVKAEDNSSNATITFTNSLFTVKKLDNGNYCAVIFEDKVSNNHYVFKNCKFQYTDASGTHELPLNNSTKLTVAPYKTMFVLGEGSTCQFN